MVIDLGEVARRAAAKAEAAKQGQPEPVTVDRASIAWQSFQALIQNDKASGRVHPEKVLSTLWTGYSTGFDTGFRVHEQAVQEAFNSGALTFGGHPPAWWDELLRLAGAVCDNGLFDETGNLSALCDHLAPPIIEGEFVPETEE